MQDQTRSSPPSSSERSSSSAPQTDSKEGMDSDEEIGRVPEFGMEQGGPSTSGGEQAAAGTSSEPAQSSSAAQASARRRGRSPADKEHRRLKSPTSPAPEGAPLEKPVAISSAVEETANVSPAVEERTTEAVKGSAPTPMTEEIIAIEATMTTEVVVMAGAEMANKAVKASNTGGDGAFDHHAGKEVVEDIPLGPQGEVTITEEEEKEYLNFFYEFFGPVSIVGSSAIRSRNRVPHPKDIPNRGNILDEEHLKKVWWNRVEVVDELKNPTRKALEQIVTIAEYNRQLIQLLQ